MKPLLVLIAFMTCACSAPRYNYYLDHVSNNRQETGAQKGALNDDKGLEASAAVHAPPRINSQNKSPELSSNDGAIVKDKQVVGQARAQFSKLTVDQKNAIKAAFRANKKDIRKKYWESPDGIARRKASNNGFAIAGFVCSLVGLFVLWPLCVLGIIFSAIGLKSDRRGLAIAGLIIGIVGVALVLFVAARA
jgi:hypothetical protein